MKKSTEEQEPAQVSEELKQFSTLSAFIKPPTDEELKRDHIPVDINSDKNLIQRGSMKIG